MTNGDYNASQGSHVKAAKQAAKIAELQLGDAVRGIMSTKVGRAWLHNILVRTHVFSNPFTSNALTMAFACGELNIGQQFLADIMRFCPDDYILMMREQNERDTIQSNVRTQAGHNGSGDDYLPTSNGHLDAEA